VFGRGQIGLESRLADARLRLGALAHGLAVTPIRRREQPAERHDDAAEPDEANHRLVLDADAPGAGTERLAERDEDVARHAPVDSGCGAAPSPPDEFNLLGTDNTKRDVLARVIYGFRLSILFTLIVTSAASVIGMVCTR